MTSNVVKMDCRRNHGAYALRSACAVRSEFMENVVICPACLHANDQSVSYCTECRLPLQQGMSATPDQASRLAVDRQSTSDRIRVARSTVSVFGLLLLAGWIVFGIARVGVIPTPPVSDIGSIPVNGSWPMYQRDPSHSAFVPENVGTPEGRILWTFETAAPLASSPAVVNGTVYLSTGDRRVVALNAATGDLVWERRVSGPVNSSPGVAGDLLYVGLRDGHLLALNTSTGDLVWQFDANELIFSSPAAYKGVVYFGSSDKQLYALDAETGAVHWRYAGGSRFVSAPAVGEEVVVINSQDNRVYLVDRHTGRHRLDYYAGIMYGAPALDGDLAYIPISRGTVLAIDWRKKELPFEDTATWIRRNLFIWGIVNTLPVPKGYGWAFTKRGEFFETTPALDADKVYATSNTGAVYALNRLDGAAEWMFKADARVASPPSIVGRTLYFGDEVGNLYGVDTETGQPTWRFQVEGQIVSSPVISNGTIYVTSENGTLYAIR